MSKGDAPGASTTSNVTTVEARSYELDAYEHVNIAVYVNWFEHGRLCFLSDRGMTYTSIPADYGVHAMVVRQDLNYQAQVRLGDRLAMTSGLARIGRTSFTFRQTLTFDSGDPAATTDVTLVCVGEDGKAAPIPAELRARLES